MCAYVNTFNLQVGVVRKEDRVFRALKTEEIDQHLTAISERD
jgi:20S proteasome subunit alpha 1